MIITAIIISLLLVFVIISIKNLAGEENKIYSALLVSQHNRDQIFKAEKVSESMLLVELKYKEYCTTFKKSALDGYKKEVSNLAENLKILQQSVSENSKEQKKIYKIFGDKAKEAEIYVKLRILTDSLIFSTANLENKHFSLEKYIENISKIKVDTVSISKTEETMKKGLFGKIKGFVVGDKEQKKTDTKLVINTSEQLANINAGTTESDKIQEKLDNLQAYGSADMKKLIRKANELKKSELKLLEINNHLIAEIGKITDEIKTDVKNAESVHNKSFLDSVYKSTYELQKILYIIIFITFVLAIYIIHLAYKTDKFQKNIVRLNEEITKASIEKDMFYSVLSHDLMNPFNALLGFSEMLNDSVKNSDNKDAAEYSAIVQQSAKRIFNLLQNLLIWSRVQNGKIEFAPTTVKVNELLFDSKMILDPIATSKQIELQWNTEKEITALLDKNMITSVIQNLVTNAVKFTPRGGKVKISSTAGEKNFSIEVADSGIGMDEKRMNELFRLDKNSTYKGTDNESGSGLGLIICKEFIEKHGGSISVSSQPGKGTIFVVNLPLSTK